jgi:hypothetical protein
LSQKLIQLRLIVGGGRIPDLASALIAGYTGGFSHVDSIVPAGLDWAPEGWLYGARSDKLSAVKCLSCASEADLAVTDGWEHTPDNIIALVQRLGVPAGVQLRPPGYTTFHRCVILTVPVVDQQFADFWAAQHEKLGRPYDWRSIVAFAAPFGLTRDWHEADSWICSEAVEDSLEKAKILSAFWLAPYKISPGLGAARVEVLPAVWSTEIKQGTDPRREAAIALEDWHWHCAAFAT